MPTELPEGLTLGAISAREVPYDALVSPVYKTLDKLPEVLASVQVACVVKLNYYMCDRTLRSRLSVVMYKLG